MHHPHLQNSGMRQGFGMIELVLIEAKDLVAADIRGTSDPYVRVHYGNTKRRTKVRQAFYFRMTLVDNLLRVFISCNQQLDMINISIAYIRI